MLLGRLKIRTRIYVGFSSLIVLGIAIAVVGSLGIDALTRQTVKLTALTGNIHFVAASLEGEELIARLLLRASNTTDDSLKARFHDVQARVHDALAEATAKTLSATRRDIYQSVLGKLDALAQSADRSFDLDRVIADGSARMAKQGGALTTAAARLVAAARDTQSSSDDDLATAAVDRAVLMVRFAAVRFLWNKNPAGPADFRTQVTTALAALDQLEKLDGPDQAASIQQVRAGLTAYRDAFEMTAPAMIALSEGYEKVQRPLIDGMEEELTKADSTLVQDAAQAETVSTELGRTTSELQIAAAGIALFSGLTLAFFIGRSITRPISSMTATMGLLAGGNRTVAIPGADSPDEIGDMARAVNVFKISMIEGERLSALQEAARAARARRQDAMDRHTQAFGNSITGVLSALGAAAAKMRRAADIMTESAAAVRQEASETAGGAGKSSADLTAVAAAVEQFTASVGEISRQVAVASDVANQAVRRAETSQATIRGLADSTARIGDVVRLIDTIAGQTNLLALNATIEAARAGEAGKGFAVVAGEVKALATQTAKATAEIGAQIETVRGATEDTVAAMNEIGGIIGRMGEVSTAISAAVEEQSATTREIASSIQGVAGSTAQAAQAMGHVVQVADRAGDASRDILNEAAEIGAESEKLRREVEAFLQAVQTDAGERRRFERISGNDFAATLRVPGMAGIKAAIQDISRSGIALRHRGMVAAGQDVEIDLPDAGGAVTGRVIRAADGVVAIAFSETPAMLMRIDRTLASLSAGREAA